MAVLERKRVDTAADNSVFQPPTKKAYKDEDSSLPDGLLLFVMVDLLSSRHKRPAGISQTGNG
eukprot:CAMPEP_0170067514 /NCGR_PEP_ID=MMETSP0019_2-20121128/6830_1 /TAXON_ID=98059 /ORGANISM="Dinobryon sp., Strain UTEXLB2267" /LENGTH=62 /DNA_ID=CAMNT_0010274917 /DNA_START=1248 /DNA_END=1436 /DNA_ORIENTATION=+